MFLQFQAILQYWTSFITNLRLKTTHRKYRASRKKYLLANQASLFYRLLLKIAIVSTVVQKKDQEQPIQNIF